MNKNAIRRTMLVGPLAVVISVWVAGCSHAAQRAVPPGSPPGSDRDAHGCIPSAGYKWCETKHKCLRPWEEQCKPSPTRSSRRKDALNEFEDLTHWSVKELSVWRLSSSTHTYMPQYKGGHIIELSRTFNARGFPGPDVEAQLKKAWEDERALATAVRVRLPQNGWKLVREPPEPESYEQYIYARNGKALILGIGNRDALIGGMYVSIQLQY